MTAAELEKFQAEQAEKRAAYEAYRRQYTDSVRQDQHQFREHATQAERDAARSQASPVTDTNQTSRHAAEQRTAAAQQ